MSDIQKHLIENPLGISVSLTINEDEFGRTLSEDVTICENDIQYEFLRQAELFAWWATMVEIARDHVGRLSLELKRKAAEIDHSVRMEAKLANEEAINAARKANMPDPKNLLKLTEKMVENSVLTHEAYREIEDELLEMKKQLGLLIAGKDALAQKKEMLISLGANLRAEGMANPVILRNAARETMRSTARPAKSPQKPPIRKPVSKKTNQTA